MQVGFWIAQPVVCRTMDFLCCQNTTMQNAQLPAKQLKLRKAKASPFYNTEVSESVNETTWHPRNVSIWPVPFNRKSIDQYPKLRRPFPLKMPAGQKVCLPLNIKHCTGERIYNSMCFPWTSASFSGRVLVQNTTCSSLSFFDAFCFNPISKYCSFLSYTGQVTRPLPLGFLEMGKFHNYVAITFDP